MHEAKEKIVAALDRLHKAHDEWIHSPAEQPDAQFWRAADHVVLAFANGVGETGQIPEGLERAYLACIRFIAARTEYEAACERVLYESLRPTVPQTFWEAFESLLNSPAAGEVQPQMPRLESVAQLHAEGVTPCQISKMWGISLAQTLAEIDEPGSGIPAGHIPPPLRNFERRMQALDIDVGQILLTAVSIRRRQNEAQLAMAN